MKGLNLFGHFDPADEVSFQFGFPLEVDSEFRSVVVAIDFKVLGEVEFLAPIEDETLVLVESLIVLNLSGGDFWIPRFTGDRVANLAEGLELRDDVFKIIKFTETGGLDGGFSDNEVVKKELRDELDEFTERLEHLGLRKASPDGSG